MPRATKNGAAVVGGVPVVELNDVDGNEARAPNIRLASKSTRIIIGRKGTMSHATDICESDSMRIRASRRRFSSTTLSVSAPFVTVSFKVPYLSHRTRVDQR